MPAIVHTRQGDMVDAICQRHYGATSGYVERVLTANPGLADYGPRLPMGIAVTLPDVPRTAERVIVTTLGFST